MGRSGFCHSLNVMVARKTRFAKARRLKQTISLKVIRPSVSGCNLLLPVLASSPMRGSQLQSATRRHTTSPSLAAATVPSSCCHSTFTVKRIATSNC